MQCVKSIKLAFPELTPGFYEILIKRIRANGFSNKRFERSVQHVIDNCLYPRPTIAEFLKYDRSVEIFSYDKVLQILNDTGPTIWKLLEKIEIDGNHFWIYKQDLKYFDD